MNEYRFIELLNKFKDEINENAKRALDDFKRELITQLAEKEKTQNERIDEMERFIRRKNIIIYGIKEKEREKMQDMEDYIIKILEEASIISLNGSDIDYIKRIGKPGAGSNRPICVSFVAQKMKQVVMKNKRKLRALQDKIIIDDDYPPHVREMRKNLVPQMITARKEGKFAIIRYDKLIVEDFGKNKKEHADRQKRTLQQRSPRSQKSEEGNQPKRSNIEKTKEDQEKINKYFDKGQIDRERSENVNRSRGQDVDGKMERRDSGTAEQETNRRNTKA